MTNTTSQDLLENYFHQEREDFNILLKNIKTITAPFYELATFFLEMENDAAFTEDMVRDEQAVLGFRYKDKECHVTVRDIREMATLLETIKNWEAANA